MNKVRIQKPQMNELMIVNPGGSFSGYLDHRSSPSNQFFWGLDGSLYQLAEVKDTSSPARVPSIKQGTVFIGEDGYFYVPINFAKD
jgi:hypothetical protein